MLSQATQGTAKTVDEIIEEQRQALGLDWWKLISLIYHHYQ
jgi:hypothetical protein